MEDLFINFLFSVVLIWTIVSARKPEQRELDFFDKQEHKELVQLLYLYRVTFPVVMLSAIPAASVGMYLKHFSNASVETLLNTKYAMVFCTILTAAWAIPKYKGLKHHFAWKFKLLIYLVPIGISAVIYSQHFH